MENKIGTRSSIWWIPSLGLPDSNRRRLVLRVITTPLPISPRPTTALLTKSATTVFFFPRRYAFGADDPLSLLPP